MANQSSLRVQPGQRLNLSTLYKRDNGKQLYKVAAKWFFNLAADAVYRGVLKMWNGSKWVRVE